MAPSTSSTPSTPSTPSSIRNFTNRRNGVMKKANALSRMHRARVAVLVEWSGSTYCYRSHPAWPPLPLDIAPENCFNPDNFETVADRVSPPAQSEPPRNAADDIPAVANELYGALQSYITSEGLPDWSSVASSDGGLTDSSTSSYSPGEGSVASSISSSTGSLESLSVVNQPVGHPVVAGTDRTAPLPTIVGVDEPAPPAVVATSPDDASQETPLRRTPRRALNTRSQQRAKRYFDQ